MGILSLFTSKKQSGFPALKLHNTLSGEVEVFEPLNGIVKMYNCGPTVYEQQHIGNLRGPLLANTLRKTLKVWGYPVKHVSNITDVGHLTGDNAGDADIGEDRMEASAKKRGLSAQEIAETITQLYFNDLDQLGIDRSKIEFPRATAYIAEQIALVKTLEEKGYAYIIDDGVYFDTSKFAAYGKLGHINLGGQKDGARVEENMQKKNAHDFALWKFSPKGGVRQQEWQSPWGTGFPGWHIECTAMIFTLLGKQIDIHLGGIDLVPIHHNNEIAQAEAATGKQFVRYWMHNAFITIEGKRLSKSQGNTIYLHQIIERGFSPLALRYWYLTGHYRSPMNFTWEAIEGADTALKRLARAYLEMSKDGEPDSKFLEEFYKAVANDLDTPKALALVWEHIKNLNQATLVEADKILGLELANMRQPQKLAVVAQTDLPEEVQTLMKERETARESKDFTKADELRGQIEVLGYDIKDTPEGQKLSKK
ncbi:MAG TPA: cysteine--tRNA ligase [Candidatus Paceibacterota bacterium]|nr:cysteine--tRNA ligase [Candidatus Paceibacterota bacterium]